MPPAPQSSSQHRDPLVPSEPRLRASGVTIRGDRPEASAVRTYDQLEGKARQLCGRGQPVVFTAVDWGVPRIVPAVGSGQGEDAELVFTVHTGHRVAIRLTRAKTQRLLEALGMVLGVPIAGPAAEPTVAAPAPAAPAAQPAKPRKVYHKLKPSAVQDAYTWLLEQGGTFTACAKALGVNLNSLHYRMRGAYGPDFMERIARSPLLKPNGKIL